MSFYFQLFCEILYFGKKHSCIELYDRNSRHRQSLEAVAFEGPQE